MPIIDVRLPVRLLAAVASAALATACAAGDPGTARPETLHVADLTHVLDETFPFIPVPGITFPFKRTPIATNRQARRRRAIADAARFVNADARGSMHFPGISEEAAAFLAHDRRVAGIGVDTLSIDPGVDKTFRTHRAWLGAGKWALEVVANLARVPPHGATLFVGAPRVRAATGGPARLLATWPAGAAR